MKLTKAQFKKDAKGNAVLTEVDRDIFKCVVTGVGPDGKQTGIELQGTKENVLKELAKHESEKEVK